MNKSAIQKFAMWARTTLMEQVAQRAYQYGITKDGYGEENAVTVNGIALSTQEQSQRRELVREIQAKGYDQVVEEVAYTWFNRFIALRYMEVNNYLPSHIRVFSNAQGAFDPEILKEALHLDLPGLDQSKVAEYIEKNETEALYRYLLLTQCNALSESLPKMFEKMGGYTELLFPNNILRPDSVPGRMVADIPEEDWTDQVQIIGWLYQYYNSEKKDQVFARPSGEKIKKEDIPAATQLFTPDWIVRYMVENSLGRLWIDHLEGDQSMWHPDDGKVHSVDEHDPQIKTFKAAWRYYLDEAEQPEELEEALWTLKSSYAELKPEGITLIDPCMGSGHILVYAFDVLMQIYESQGWSQRDAAASIVERNLYGLDIDQRAAQLAYFAVMMKARQYDRRFLTRGIQPNLYHPGAYADGQEFGSLLVVDELEPKPEQPDEITLFDSDYVDKLNTWNFRSLLARQYDVVVTNPPYMGSSNMNDKLSKFVKDNYPDAKSDLFSCFIERELQFVKPEGFLSVITMESWMFLSSFEKLRQKIVSSHTIINMVHMPYLGKGGTSLGINFGTTAVVFNRRYICDYNSQFDYICYYETDDDGVPFQFPTVNERYKVAKATNFSKIPGAPVAYWVSEAFYKTYSYPQIGDTVIPRHGLATSDNNRFLRLWFEVSMQKTSILRRCDFSKKWYPMNKGGAFRKWYGNLEWVINYENDGEEIKNYAILLYKSSSRTIQNTQFYFKEGITWSALTSGALSFRWSDIGAIFGSGAHCAFAPDSDTLMYGLALLNGKVSSEYLSIVSPTLNTNVDDIRATPYIEKNKHTVIYLVKECIATSKNDWDSYETSWDFKRHPLV